MRGKDVWYLVEVRFVGITPAYAGKSEKPMDRAATARDHPRVCGEKYEAKDQKNQDKGSPPRMRGKVLLY